MRSWIWTAIAALYFFLPVSAAEPRWLRIPSADFEVFSSASEGYTRETLKHFERVRSFFEQAMGSFPAKMDPIRIIVFGSKKEFDPYRLNESAVAYYTQVRGRDYIVLGDSTAEAFPIATHEFCHLIAQHAGLNLPVWLNEGLAEVYSTMKPQGDKVVVGMIIPARLRALGFEKSISLATLLTVDRNSPFYNEKDKAGVFYDESWALTHMLQLSLAYGPKFTSVIEAIRTGTPSGKALETIYGKTLTEIENDLRSYVRGNSFRGSVFPIKVENQTARADVEPAAAFDVKLALLDLTNRPGRQDETRQELEALTGSDPKRPEPYVSLGYLAMSTGHTEDASKHFRKALELGSRNPNMLWDYGRLSMMASPEDSIHALDLLLADQPGRMDVRLVLAQTHLNAKQWRATLATLRPIRSVSPEYAPVYFRLTAFSVLNLGNTEAARGAGLRWLENAGDSADRENARAFQKYLDSLEAAALKPAPSSGSVLSASPLPPPVFATTLAVPGLDLNVVPPPAASVEPEEATFRSIANFISVDAQVLVKGKSVVGLRREDFEIRDNGRLQTISNFGTEDQPIDLILLLDYSASTREIETRVKNSAAEAMSLLHADDRVGVMVFDTKAQLMAPLTSYFERVDAAIRAISWIGRNTELNATLLSAATYLRQQARPGARRHIIVLSDNKGDAAIGDQAVRDSLWESDTVVSLIRFETSGQGYVNRPFHADLRSFVTDTGGDLLDDNRAGTGLVEIFQHLHERYVILYRAPLDKPGSVHHVQVALPDQARFGNAQVHARTGYREVQREVR
jgi:VWFA-related protein